MAANKVFQGQGVGSNPLFNSAGVINDVLDMRTRFKREQLSPTPERLRGLPLTTDQVRVKNQTGDWRNRGDVIQLGDYLLEGNDLYPEYLWFAAETPALPLGRIGIMLEGVPDDGDETPCVRCAVSGVCIANVDVTDIDHTHGRAEVDSYALTSDFDGPVEFLSPLTDLGEQLVAVRFQREIFRLGKLDTALEHGSTVNVSLWQQGTTGAVVDSGETIEATGDWLLQGTSGTLPRGTAVIVGWIDTRWYILQLCDRLLGKTDSAIRKGARGWVSIYLGEHTAETDTGDNVLAMNKFADVGSGKWVWVDRTQYGFYLVAAECGDAATENVTPTTPPPDPEPYPSPGPVTTDDGGRVGIPGTGTDWPTAGGTGGSDDGGITYGGRTVTALTAGSSGAMSSEPESGGERGTIVVAGDGP